MTTLTTTVTVPTTVTVTPTPVPDYLVEVSNLETSTWTWPVIITLGISLLALLVSVGSLWWQRRAFEKEGARTDFRAKILGSMLQTAVIRVSLLNVGRMAARTGSVEVNLPGFSLLPVEGGDFPALHRMDEEGAKVELVPGEMFYADLNFEFLAFHAQGTDVTLRDFYFETWVNGETLVCRLSRKDAREWHFAFKEELAAARKSWEITIRDMTEIGMIVPHDVSEEHVPVGTWRERLEIWFRTLR